MRDRPISTNKIDQTDFKCQIIQFTLTPSDSYGQERRYGQQLVLCQSGHLQTLGGTCPSAPCLATPLPVQVPLPDLQVPVPVQVLCISYR